MTEPVAHHRDSEVVRRGLRAGGTVAIVLGALLVGRVLVLDVGGHAGAVAALAAVTAGALVTAGWLLLAGLLDLLADQLPSRRRVVWTVAAAAVAGVMPLVTLAAQGAA